MSRELIKATEYLRIGEYSLALKKCDNLLKKRGSTSKDTEYWAWLLGSICFAFLKNQASFEHYLYQADKISVKATKKKCPYLKLLQAFNDALSQNTQEAIIKWTQILDAPNEKWFAEKLLRKIKNDKHLLINIELNQISEFILLPNLSGDLQQQEQMFQNEAQLQEYVTSLFQDDPVLEEEKPTKVSRTIKKKTHAESSHTVSKRKEYKIAIILLLVLFSFSFIYIIFFYVNKFKQNKLLYTQTHVQKNASTNVTGAKKVFKYANDSKILEDFELAKKNIKLKKVNQARFLLQKIIYSNAHFGLVQNAQHFLQFIPYLDIYEFFDFITPTDVLKNPILYQRSQVLWSGIIQSIKEVDNGKEIDMLIYENKKKYDIKAFFYSKRNKTNLHNIKDFKLIQKEHISLKKNRESTAHYLNKNNQEGIIYGIYHNVFVNKHQKEKSLYIEVEKLWL